MKINHAKQSNKKGTVTGTTSMKVGYKENSTKALTRRSDQGSVRHKLVTKLYWKI